MFALRVISCCWLAQPGDFLKEHAVTSILFVGLIFSFGFGGLENAFGADEVACLAQEASGLGPAVLRFTVESESKIIARAFKGPFDESAYVTLVRDRRNSTAEFAAFSFSDQLWVNEQAQLLVLKKSLKLKAVDTVVLVLHKSTKALTYSCR